MSNRCPCQAYLFVGALLLAACSSVRPLPGSANLPVPGATVPPSHQTPAPSTPAASTPAATISRWEELVAWSPYPHTMPLPPQADTPLDGRYVRFDPRTQARVPCRRCPPYPPEGGIWVLEFDKGVFRVYHPRTGWRTLGSYTVDGGRVTLFNDPQCHRATGSFAWSRDDQGLRFRLIEDDCELGTRTMNFTTQAWKSCPPPSPEAGVAGRWSVPEGCDPTALEAALKTKAPTLSQ